MCPHRAPRLSPRLQCVSPTPRRNRRLSRNILLRGRNRHFAVLMALFCHTGMLREPLVLREMKRTSTGAARLRRAKPSMGRRSASDSYPMGGHALFPALDLLCQPYCLHLALRLLDARALCSATCSSEAPLSAARRACAAVSAAPVMGTPCGQGAGVLLLLGVDDEPAFARSWSRCSRSALARALRFSSFSFSAARSSSAFDARARAAAPPYGWRYPPLHAGRLRYWAVVEWAVPPGGANAGAWCVELERWAFVQSGDSACPASLHCVLFSTEMA
jgi:hypothetical protein